MADKVWTDSVGGGANVVEKALGAVKNFSPVRAAQKWYGKVTRGGVLRMVVLPFLLFLLFAPGYALSIPKASKEFCATQSPIPAQTGAVNATCDPCAATPAASCGGLSNAELKPICDARTKCTSMTSPMVIDKAPWLVHAILFTIVFGILTQLVNFTGPTF